MILKAYTAEQLLLVVKRRRGLDHVQVSGSAIFRFAQLLEAEGLAMAESTFAGFREDKEDRRRLRLKDIKRLTDEHVEEALDGGH